MGSDESHFNVSVDSDGQSHKTSVHKPQPFWRERRAEAVSNRGPSAYQPNALPLGQSGSHTKSSRSRIDKRTARATGNTRYRYSKIAPLDHKMADNCFPGPHKYTFLYNN